MIKRVDIELIRKGLSRTALKDVGIPSSSLSSWSTGKRTPSTTSVAQMADFLGVSMEYLLFGRERDDDLTQDERELVEAYRQLSVQSRAVVLTAAKGLRQ